MAEPEVPAFFKEVLRGLGNRDERQSEAPLEPQGSGDYLKFRGEMAAGLWGPELTSQEAIDAKIKSFHDKEREARTNELQRRKSQGLDILDSDLNYFLPEGQKIRTQTTPQPKEKPEYQYNRRTEPPVQGEQDPRTQSWMNNDPLTWYPRDASEKARWRKSLSNKDLVEWTKLAKEASDWHLRTRNGGAPAYTWGLPEYREFRQRYDAFMKRTTPAWRQHEQKNPPRRYRPRRADLQALGGYDMAGLNSEENGVG